jgi:hypothetical protein
MPTPAAVTPPTPENAHLYRAAALAYRKAWRAELHRHGGDHKLTNPHIPLRAAALAVQEASPAMTVAEAEAFAQRACSWAAQAHNAWFWR